jgi:type II secretory pathway pseudopilin PulG
MTRRLRRRLADIRAGRTAGFTLVEIIVVTALLMLVLGVAQEAVIMTSRIVGDNAVRLDESQQAKTATEAMSQTLRTAILPKQLSGTCTGCDVAAFISGDAKSVRFYANINNDLAVPTSGTTSFGPRKVSYVLSTSGATSGTLTETIQAPDVHAYNNYNFTYCAPGPTCPVRTRILARNVVTTQSLFTYYSKTGAVLPVPLEASTSYLQAVDSIDVLLTVKPRGRVEGTTVTTRVMLPNADSAPTPSAT